MAEASISRVPAIFSRASCQGLLSPISSMALSRRAMGGQWPMIISGTISVLAGILFIANAGVRNPTLASAIGYAIPGAIFFLLSAIRLGRAAKGTQGN